MQLKDKRIFITGGTGGIGKPLTALLRTQGAIVESYNRKNHGPIADRLPQVLQVLRDETPDILINMAATNAFARCEDQDIRSLVTLNLTIPMQLTQACLPAMRARRSGQIVNIGSMTGLIPLPHMTAYAATKAGLKAFSDSLRRELHGTGITVTHISPRAVRTAMNEGVTTRLHQRTGIKSDDPAIIARRIMRAIIDDEHDVRIGWPERLFALIHAVLPHIIDKGLREHARIGEELLSQQPARTEHPDETHTADRRHTGT